MSDIRAIEARGRLLVGLGISVLVALIAVGCGDSSNAGGSGANSTSSASSATSAGGGASSSASSASHVSSSSGASAGGQASSAGGVSSSVSSAATSTSPGTSSASSRGNPEAGPPDDAAARADSSQAADTGGAGDSGAVPSAGCGKTPTLAAGTQSIQSSGQTRSFMMRLPPNYDKNHPYWLIFGFHWVGGTANDVDSGGSSGYTWSYYGLREKADTSTSYQAIFVAPQGISNGWANSGGQDVTFTDDILSRIEGDLCVDTKHVFSTGFSYGGGMTKALGCQRPNVFRAIAVYSGADFLSGGCDNTTTSPIAYIGLHSITDPTNPYTSGETIRDRFVKNDGCTPQTPPEPAQNSLTHVCTTYQGCKAGYPVEWCAFNGGGHTPAPVDGSTNGSGGGDTTWTKAEVWKFFTQF